MEQSICLSSEGLATFLTRLPQQIVEFGTNEVLIHTTSNGIVRWVWVEAQNLWAINGETLTCILTGTPL